MINKRGLRSEITQLFLAAFNFAEMAKASYAKLDPDYQTMPVSTLGKRFDSSNFNEKDELALFTLSYVSSSAIRISTILEAIGLKPTAKDLYKRGIKSSDRVSFLCHYLRDNVCHREPAPGENFEDRQKYLDSLTVKEILENTLKQIASCFQEIRNLSDTLGNIGTNTRMLTKMREAVG